MFENILGLPAITERISADITSGRLPAAILLAGPRYGGKGSIALEIARGLTCRMGRSWNCTCHACQLQRGLQHQDTLFAGERPFELEIAAAAAAFLREPRAGTAYLLVRAVRKLTRRFDAVLWPDARVRTVQDSVDAVEEALTAIEPTGEDATPWSELSESDRTACVETIVRAATALQGKLPHDVVPVDLVRAISSWAHVSSAGGAKVVIMEEAHLLHDSARNAMLKILEEPPEGVWFILTTSRRSAVIPTVLSRVRTYAIPERAVPDQLAVQERIFRVTSPVEPRLNEFFRHHGAHEHSWQTLARRFVACAHRTDDPVAFERDLAARLTAGPIRSNAEFFLEALTDELRSWLAAGRAEEAALWNAEIDRCWGRIAIRNMNPRSVLSDLLLAVGRASEAMPMRTADRKEGSA